MFKRTILLVAAAVSVVVVGGVTQISPSRGGDGFVPGAVQGNGFKLHFLAVLPDQRPTGVARDAFALPVGLRHAVNLRARRNNQPAAVINVFGDEADDGRLHGS